MRHFFGQPPQAPPKGGMFASTHAGTSWLTYAGYLPNPSEGGKVFPLRGNGKGASSGEAGRGLPHSKRTTEQIPPCGRNDCTNSVGKRQTAAGDFSLRSKQAPPLFAPLFPKSRLSFRMERSGMRNLNVSLRDLVRLSSYPIGYT